MTTTPLAPFSIVYVVAATGGYDQPSYVSFVDEAAARANCKSSISTLLQEESDRLEILKIEVFSDGITHTTVIHTELFEYRD